MLDKLLLHNRLPSVFTREQDFGSLYTFWGELSLPLIRLKKEKHEAKKLKALSTPNKDNPALVDQSTVSVIGAVDDQGTHVEPPEKKLKEDKVTTKVTKVTREVGH